MTPARATPPAPWAASAPRSPVEELTSTIGFALQALADPTAPHPAVSSGRLLTTLRAAIRGISNEPASGATRAAAATRVACAYLWAGDLREAHLALLAADNAVVTRLPRPATAQPVTAQPAAAGSQRQRTVS